MKLKYLVIVYNLHLASFINITKVYTEDIIFFGHDSVVSLIISYLKLAVLFFCLPMDALTANLHTFNLGFYSSK